MMYKHKKRFKGGNKTVEEAIQYFISCGDFVLDLKKNIKTSDQIGSSGYITHEYAINHCLETKQFDKLRIVYRGKEGGSDGNIKHVTEFIKQKFPRLDEMYA